MKFDWFRRKLRRKIAITLIIIPGLVAIFIVFATQSVATGSIISVKKESIREATISESVNISEVFDNSKNLAKAIAKSQRPIDFLQNGKKIEDSPYLIYNLGTIEYIEDIKLIDKYGIISASANGKSIGNDESKESYFINGMSGEENLYIGRDFSKKSVKYRLTEKVINSNGEVVGLVQIEINPLSIYKNLNKTTLRDVGDVMVIDTDGIVLYSSEDKDYMKSLWTLNKDEQKAITRDHSNNVKIDSMEYEDTKSHITQYLGPTTFEFRCKADDYEKELVSLSRSGDYPVFVVAEIEVEELTADLLKGATIITFIDISLIAIGASIVTKLLFYFLRPLKNIQKTIESIDHNNLEQDITIETIDEFSEIEATLNSITKKLNDKKCQQCLNDTVLRKKE